MSEDATNALASAAMGATTPEPSLVKNLKDKPQDAGWFRRLSLFKKALVVLAAMAPPAIALLWWAVHTFPWAGPLVANSLRATIGKDNVTSLEEFVYSIEDRVNRTVKSGEAPKTYWKVPETSAATKPPVVQVAPKSPEQAEVSFPVFAPKAVGPVHDAWTAEGDGEWVPMTDPRTPNEAPRMFKTLLHPDSSRSWAELFVVAVDLRTVSVLPVMGYQEPRSDKKEAEGYQRAAKIPEANYDALLAAFNGGFMAEHGAYGVYFDGITFIDPKDEACTLAHYKNGSFSVATWSEIKSKVAEMEWYRQAPNCMFEHGKIHPSLKAHHARKWGATLDGNTVIRRSAVGLSPDKQVLYVGISNHTNAKVMAVGMNHAGAEAVAQMDVNWSYPKFVTFEPDKDKVLHPVALAEGFEFSDALYLRERSMRDFFYLARKEMIEPAGPKPSEPSSGTAPSDPDKSPQAAAAPP